jgi:serine/threonine protein phosphatase PrpC
MRLEASQGSAARQPPRFRSVSRSHVGLVRAINEDRVFDCCKSGIWAVVDGMGGHAGGDLAAQSVIDQLRLVAEACRSPRFADVVTALRSANDDILRRNAGMGSDAGATVAAVVITDRTAHIAWAGDSRVYQVRNGFLRLLTTDHSVVQELVDAGLLKPEDAPRHPQAHVVTRALGVSSDPGLETLSFPLAPGDRVVLCSDGLSRSLAGADTIGGDIETVADNLLENALRRDGSDNVSFIVVDPG